MKHCRRAIVALPGGDAIGSRPLDMHQAGLRAMGPGAIEHGLRRQRGTGADGHAVALDSPPNWGDGEHPDSGGYWPTA